MKKKPATYCNPININYRFQVRGWADKCLREAADPSAVRFKDRYWLFPSKSGGYWHSTDLKKWIFIESRKLPVEDYAPDVAVIDGALYFTAGSPREGSTIFKSQDPGKDDWQIVSHPPFRYGDPKMFQDDDGRVYFYFGCSNSSPIRGIELDRRTMMPVGEQSQLIPGRPSERGWERRGEDNIDTDKQPGIDRQPWIEGAWMNKRNGRYYLQYAAPGTEWNVYGDGVCVSSSPLGPFEYARHNPFSFKPGGFITGAGHGSTIEDAFGNLWHFATMRMSVKHTFERRIGMFPAGFDEDGNLFCNTSFGDYPAKIPAGKWNPMKDAFAGWMLLSFNKRAKASSCIDGYPPDHAFNEDIRTYWSARSGNEGEWLEVDLGSLCTINAVQINFAEHDCQQYAREGAPLFHRCLLEASEDGRKWFAVEDKRNSNEDAPHDYFELVKAIHARHLRLTNFHMPGGGTFAVSGLRVFGKGAGTPPPAVQGTTASLVKDDPMTAGVSWKPVETAAGYNVRWGLAPDKLYSSWMLYGKNSLVLRSLNKGTEYWLAVDAFNENGITPGEPVRIR